MSRTSGLAAMFDLKARRQIVQLHALSALAFSVLLPTILLARLIPNQRAQAKALGRSILREAREASGTVARLAFAG